MIPRAQINNIPQTSAPRKTGENLFISRKFLTYFLKKPNEWQRVLNILINWFDHLGSILYHLISECL